MRWRVVVQASSLTGNTVTWANTSAWAAVSTMQVGPEGQVAGQVQGQVNYVLTMRTGTSINAKNRVIFGTKTLQVQSVRLLGPAYIEVLAIEKQ